MSYKTLQSTSLTLANGIALIQNLKEKLSALSGYAGKSVVESAEILSLKHFGSMELQISLNADNICCVRAHILLKLIKAKRHR